MYNNPQKSINIANDLKKRKTFNFECDRNFDNTPDELQQIRASLKQWV